MARNLRLFDTVSNYQSADLVYPSVSYVVENDKVYYDATAPALKWKATYQDGSIASAACDASSAITSGEITRPNLVSVEIGDCVTSIGEQVFYQCYSLSSITIPNGVTSIGKSCFHQCSSLTSITIPDSVTSLGETAFNWCAGLKSITFGSGLTEIGNSCFNQCSNVTTMTSYAIVPPEVGEYAFQDLRYSVTALYVPASAVNAYKSTGVWRVFKNVVQAIPE